MPERPRRKAVFLDRDRTVIEDMEFSTDPARLKALPGALEGMRRLQEADYALVVVTNQSGVARGRFTEEELLTFHETLKSWLAGRGVRLAGVFHCPHYPDGAVPEYSVACGCRKPAPGMLVRAAEKLGLDLAESWMVGDRNCDTDAGRNAGCRTILVGTAPDPEPQDAEPDFRVKDLRAAADIILDQRRRTKNERR